MIKKLEGLKLLQRHFDSFCVECIFAQNVEELDQVDMRMANGRIWRVRTGKRHGSEMSLPQRTCYSIEEVRSFVVSTRSVDPQVEFVVHPVTSYYFSPCFIGTLMLAHSKGTPCMTIDLQAVSLEDVQMLDKGKRPRDWEVVAIYYYPFFSAPPKVTILREGVDRIFLREPITELYTIGRELDILRRDNTDTVTRFNIYPSGEVILDDHRTIDSFLR